MSLVFRSLWFRVGFAVYVYGAPRAGVISGAHQQLCLDGRCTDIDVAHSYMNPQQQQLSELRPTAANTLESMMIKRDFGTPGPILHIFSRWYQRRFMSSPLAPRQLRRRVRVQAPSPALTRNTPTSPKPTMMAPTRSAPSTISSYGMPLETPETPILHASNTTPSASSVSPATPAIVVELSAQIALSPGMLIRRDKPPPIHP
jgi:hypothetical protein